MTHSEQVDKLFKAFIKFKANCPEVVHDATVKVKTKKGGTYTFSYATLGNIQRTTTPTLVENGLSVMQMVGDNGKVTTILLHESGQYISTPEFGIIPKTDEGELPTPQEIGSSVTYAKRYQVSGVLDIDAMKDDDGNHGSGNEITQETERQPTQKKKVDPKPTKSSQSSPKEEPDPEGNDPNLSSDADEFIQSVKTKKALIDWWGEKINGDEEEHYRTNYMKPVMEKLKDLS